jgi:hypothetical protein
VNDYKKAKPQLNDELIAEMQEIVEHKDALWRQLQDIKRQKYQLMQRAAHIKLQLAQRGLSALQRT